MVHQPERPIDLTQLNHTELVALAQWVGIKEANRAWPRELLVYVLENFQTVGIEDPMDKFRNKVKPWLKRYWDRVRMQMTKAVCPNCEHCRDFQVLECYYRNKSRIEG
jgi:hypothetical protein